MHQSWLTLKDVGPQDATFVCWVGSHHLSPELGGKGHHKQVTPQEIRYLRSKGCIPVRLNNLSRGTQVFWLSRTVHSGMCHLPGEEHNWRMVLYVSALPKNLKGFNWPKIDQWRRELMGNGLTTHNPGRMKKHTGPRYPPKLPLSKPHGLPNVYDYRHLMVHGYTRKQLETLVRKGELKIVPKTSESA